MDLTGLTIDELESLKIQIDKQINFIKLNWLITKYSINKSFSCLQDVTVTLFNYGDGSTTFMITHPCHYILDGWETKIII